MFVFWVFLKKTPEIHELSITVDSGLPAAKAQSVNARQPARLILKEERSAVGVDIRKPATCDAIFCEH